MSNEFKKVIDLLNNHLIETFKQTDGSYKVYTINTKLNIQPSEITLYEKSGKLFISRKVGQVCLDLEYDFNSDYISKVKKLFKL